MQTKFIWAFKYQYRVDGHFALNGFLSQTVRFGDPLLTTRDSTLINSNFNFDDNLIISDFPSVRANTVDYLEFIEKYIPEELISQNNFSQLKNIAGNFSGGLTSFFGFESRLSSSKPNVDFSFAVSSKRGERGALVNLVTKNNLPEKFYTHPEWHHFSDFTLVWMDPKSILHDKVLGVWFEFDEDSFFETSVPCVFINTIPIRTCSIKNSSQYSWLTDVAMPLLIGHRLSKNIEEQLFNCINKMPTRASIFQVGTMLSRSTYGIRLLINKINSNQIIPYLQSIGWSDESGGLSSVIEELEKFVTRFVLHIHIDGKVDPKIGIECSFYSGYDGQKKEWTNFLNYLVKKGLCVQEKQDSLLRFTGFELEDINNNYDLNSFIPSVKLPDDGYSRASVRFISHIKIVYQSGQPLEAKAYLGVREYGIPNNGSAY